MAVVTEPAAPAAASRGEWSVQVAAPRDPRHAERIKRQLAGAGYRAYIVQTRRQGETYHRVRVGYYASLDAAREAASSLRHQPGITGAFVASD
jgi:cell division septation protein DedD